MPGGLGTAWRRAFAVAILLALLTGSAPPAAAKPAASLDDARLAALADLEARAQAGLGPLAAEATEVALANGLDPRAWPPRAPIFAQVQVPGDDAAFITLLRPLRALALTGDARAPDLRDRVLAGFAAGQFGEPSALNDDAFALLALDAAGWPADDERLQASAAHLRAQRNADGGWGWAAGARSGLDMTAMVHAALAATVGVTEGEAADAVAFARGVKDGDGYAESADGAATCESTAWALRLLATQDETDGAAWAFLLGLQRPSGGFAHVPAGAADAICSLQALHVLGLAAAGEVPFATPDPAGERGWQAGPASGLLGPVAALLVAALAATRARRP